MSQILNRIKENKYYYIAAAVLIIISGAVVLFSQGGALFKGLFPSFDGVGDQVKKAEESEPVEYRNISLAVIGEDGSPCKVNQYNCKYRLKFNSSGINDSLSTLKIRLLVDGNLFEPEYLTIARELISDGEKMVEFVRMENGANVLAFPEQNLNIQISFILFPTGVTESRNASDSYYVITNTNKNETWEYSDKVYSIETYKKENGYLSTDETYNLKDFYEEVSSDIDFQSKTISGNLSTDESTGGEVSEVLSPCPDGQWRNGESNQCFNIGGLAEADSPSDCTFFQGILNSIEEDSERKGVNPNTINTIKGFLQKCPCPDGHWQPTKTPECTEIDNFSDIESNNQNPISCIMFGLISTSEEFRINASTQKKISDFLSLCPAGDSENAQIPYLPDRSSIPQLDLPDSPQLLVPTAFPEIPDLLPMAEPEVCGDMEFWLTEDNLFDLSGKRELTAIRPGTNTPNTNTGPTEQNITYGDRCMTVNIFTNSEKLTTSQSCEIFSKLLEGKNKYKLNDTTLSGLALIKQACNDNSPANPPVIPLPDPTPEPRPIPAPTTCTNYDTKSSDSKICKDDTWYTCNSSSEEDIIGRYICTDDDEWVKCDDDTEDDEVGDYICDGRDWEEIEDDPNNNIRVSNHKSEPRSFNPKVQDTDIKFTLSEDAEVNLIIKDSSGKTVVTLANDKDYDKGTNTISWNGTDSAVSMGKIVDPGNYKYILKAKDPDSGSLKASVEGTIQVVYASVDFEDRAPGIVLPDAPAPTAPIPLPTPPQTQAIITLQATTVGTTSETGPGILIYGLLPLAGYFFTRKKKNK